MSGRCSGRHDFAQRVIYFRGDFGLDFRGFSHGDLLAQRGLYRQCNGSCVMVALRQLRGSMRMACAVYSYK